jgi:hypothetical protein
MNVTTGHLGLMKLGKLIMDEDIELWDKDTTAYQFEIHGTENIAVINWTGTFSRTTFIAFAKELEDHPGFHEGLDRLYDLRAANMEMDADEVRKITRRIQDNEVLHGDRKVAIAVSNDLQFGLMRIYAAIADDTRANIKLFRSRSDACLWLGLPADF